MNGRNAATDASIRREYKPDLKQLPAPSQVKLELMLGAGRKPIASVAMTLPYLSRSLMRLGAGTSQLRQRSMTSIGRTGCRTFLGHFECGDEAEGRLDAVYTEDETADLVHRGEAALAFLESGLDDSVGSELMEGLLHRVAALAVMVSTLAAMTPGQLQRASAGGRG